MRKAPIAIAAAVVFLDRVTKVIIERTIPLHESIQVIPDFFRITHVKNPGAAFGLFSDSPAQYKIALLILFSVVALIVVSSLLWKHNGGLNRTATALSLILGGAVGNLWDRVIDGRVTDFLEFYVGRYIWPDFNMADSAIVIGAMILMVEILLAPKEEKPLNQRS